MFSIMALITVIADTILMQLYCDKYCCAIGFDCLMPEILLLMFVIPIVSDFFDLFGFEVFLT